MLCAHHHMGRKKREGGCRVAVKPRCLNHVAIKGKEFFSYSSSSWKRYSAKATKLTWFYQTGLWESNLSEFIKTEGWRVRDTQYVSKGVYMWARVTVVSCQFSNFHMSELDFHVRVQCVGVLSIGYCLTRDLITKAQRQSGRQVWQAAVPEQARQCVWEQTQRDTSAFSAKWAHTNRDKKCPITLEERETIITWNSKTKMLT